MIAKWFDDNREVLLVVVIAVLILWVGIVIGALVF